MLRKGFTFGCGAVLALGLSVVLYAAATYPGGVVSLPVRTDGQTISASWFNTIHDEIVAIEGGLINGLAHDLKFTDATYDIGKSGATRPRDGFFSRNGVFGGTLAVTGAATLSGTATIGGVITAAAQPRASAYMNATQAVDDDTATAITLNTEDFDVGTMHDTGSNTSRMTIPTGGDGLYFITGQISFAGDADGFRRAQIMKNAATELSWTQINAADTDVVILQVSALASLVATDYVELYARHTSGGALNTGSATRHLGNILQIVKVW